MSKGTAWISNENRPSGFLDICVISITTEQCITGIKNTPCQSCKKIQEIITMHLFKKAR